MDDDATYHKGAISEMINYWNSVKIETAGVGFNIIYQSKNNLNFLYQTLSKFKRPGSVKRSGECISFTNLQNDIKVQWLSGGTTVWKYKILKKYKHDNNLLDLKHANCEDSIYSYPLGKNFNLMACAAAKVQIEDDIMNTKSINFHMYKGRVRYSMKLYFVLTNTEFSRILFFFNQLLILIKLFFKLIIFLDLKYLYDILGTIKGILHNMDVLFSIQHPNKLVKRIK